MVFALFEPDSELTALFYLGAVVVWGLAAFAGTTMGRRAGGPRGLVALGLALLCSRRCGGRWTWRSSGIQRGEPLMTPDPRVGLVDRTNRAQDRVAVHLGGRHDRHSRGVAGGVPVATRRRRCA
jgi:hypothetical protein